MQSISTSATQKPIWILKNKQVITKERLDKMELAGMSEQEIATVLGITRQYLHRVRCKMNWPQTTRSDKGVERIPAEEKKRRRREYMKKYFGEYRKANPDKFKYKAIRIGNKIVKEHRYKMEQHLGRKLLRSEIVHHIDGNRLNNSIENLEIMSQGEHILLHNRLREAEQEFARSA